MQKLNSSLDTFIETELNDAQQQAVKHTRGPLLVIAGAGSGKTRVITTRIARLILTHNVEPRAIVALTFTNKAAREMQERIRHFLPVGSPVPFVGTFHAYCLQLLKKNAHLMSTPFASILDADDQLKLVTTILKVNGAQKIISPKQALYQISSIKNNLTQAAADTLLHDLRPQMRELYHLYEQEKRMSKCLDFDDLLLEAVQLFKHNAFAETFHATVRHILVDEYQDTNVVQHELLKKMSFNNSTCVVDSVCVVGDEDQSIYSWRGATVANIANFCDDFKDTQVVKIEQNYRSVQPILTVANHLIAHNSTRNPKQLWSTKKAVDRVRTVQYGSEYQEAEATAQLIKIARRQSEQSIAILYRTHMQSRALEEACIKHSIPYVMIGGVQFYERKEIKDLLAYLKLIANPSDRTSLMRVINCPGRGLGAAFEELVYQQWQQQPFYSFQELLKTLVESQQIKGVKEVAVQQFLECFEGCSAQDAPAATLEKIIFRTGYISYLKSQDEPQEAETRIANVQELINAVKHMESLGTVRTVSQLLDEIALMQEKASATNKEQSAVTLMTLHAAKGLEFDIVIVAGVEEGILPSTRALNDTAALEEERRLFYVGITRARERLILSHSRYRYTYGRMTDQMPSRFLEEIPQPLQNACDLRNKEGATQRFFAQWLGGVSEEPQVFTFGIATTAPARPTVRQPVRKVTPPSKPSAPVLDVRRSPYRLHQSVQHAKYGIGIIQKIEPQDNGTTYITAQFKIGSKKILDSFLQIR